MSAIAGQRAATRAMAVPARSLLIKTADRAVPSMTSSLWAGRAAAIDDEFASGRHARFQVARGRWYVEDLGSTNGTWLNGRRIQAAQWLKKGDKIRIGHTVMTVEPA